MGVLPPRQRFQTFGVGQQAEIKMPMRSELLSSAMAIGRMRAGETIRSPFSEILVGRDFTIVLIFSAIGLVVSLCLASLLPFSDVIASVLAQSG
jgi:hypothetical protein